MAERSAERTRERREASETDAATDTGLDTDIGLGAGKSSAATAQQTATGGRESAADAEDGGTDIFSLRALIAAFLAVGAGMVAGGLVPLVPFTGVLGIALGAFAYGLVASQRRYLEVAAAGGLVSGTALTLSFLPRAVFFEGFNGPRLFAIAAAIGLVLAVVGHYFGRDLRDGLTRELA